MSDLDDFIKKMGKISVKKESDLAKMFPPDRIEQIKKKELRKFKQAQDKKWENWFEGVLR